MDGQLFSDVAHRFRSHFGCPHTAAAYAPGRVEVLGNHTDYNEGLVLSAAIDMGTFFLVAPSDDTTCRLVAADVEEECRFDLVSPTPSQDMAWSNYVKGVWAGLQKHVAPQHGFMAMFLGNIPLGAGLSSSAALEISAGVALSALYDKAINPLDLARIGQRAEHEFAGTKCGLLDQLSSLYGKAGELVMTDFRSLAIENIAMGDDTCFLMCNTGVKHALVDGQYNERRNDCEQASRFFATELDHDVQALRDVTWQEWSEHAPGMDDRVARRAAHVIGENERVRHGRELLREGNAEEFGSLMFDSHNSSRQFFENSCPELDMLVDCAAQIPGVLGARLSGGGFGGSVVVLLHPRDVDTVQKALQTSYARSYGAECDICVITPSNGAHLVKD